MKASELRALRSRKDAAVYAYRHATVLLAFAKDNTEAQEAIQLALGMLERAWERLDQGYHGTLLELAEDE